MHRFLALVLSTLFFFLVSIFLIKWLGKKWSNFLNRNKTNKASKIQGGIVMMLIGIIVFSFLLLMVNSFGLINEKIKLGSISYQTLEVIP
jgi:biotin transporter BioY